MLSPSRQEYAGLLVWKSVRVPMRFASGRFSMLLFGTRVRVTDWLE
jgi:hypothetical protein